MSGELAKALKLDICVVKVNLADKSYRYSCGLSIAIGTDQLDSKVSILTNPSLLKAAHERHHRDHNGKKASLYLIGGLDSLGNDALSAAQCSCDYDLEHPLA